MQKAIRKQLVKIAFNPFVFFKYNLLITYGIGFVISMFLFKDEYFYYSLKTMAIISFSFFLFWLGWRSIEKVKIKKLTYQSSKLSTYLFALIFILTSSYIFYYTPPAILGSLLGSDLTSSELRAMATKGKTGIDSIINGFFYASSYIGVGAFVLLFFYEKRHFKWLVLFIAIFVLLLNGQKSRFIIVILPLLMFFIQNREFKYIKILVSIAGVSLFLVMLSLSFLDIGTNTGHTVLIETQERLTQGGRDLFENQSPLKFIIHRLVWIPYITAVDWLRYIDTELTEYLMGGSIPLLSNVLGVDRINLDNAVFKFQYNVSSSSLGAANSFFAFDLIANFGYVGLLMLSPLFGMVFNIIWKGLPSPFNLMVFVWLYSFQASSFQALFLGGGMFIILFAILAKNITSSTTQYKKRQ